MHLRQTRHRLQVRLLLGGLSMVRRQHAQGGPRLLRLGWLGSHMERVRVHDWLRSWHHSSHRVTVEMCRLLLGRRKRKTAVVESWKRLLMGSKRSRRMEPWVGVRMARYARWRALGVRQEVLLE